MPYLRFLRDDRGYEHTYVLHGLQSASRPSLLYWFRTPPNVSVGRQPLDEEAIRAIEASHPDLTFDWTKMTRASRTRPAPPAGERGSRARGRRREAPPGSPAAPAPSAAQDPRTPTEAPPRPPENPVEGERATEEAVPSEATQVPAPEVAETVEPDEHPVVALLGEEALNELRARYAELCALLAESDLEPADQVAITARLESLDPDGWRPGEQTVVGIERFDRETASIHAVLDG